MNSYSVQVKGPAGIVMEGAACAEWRGEETHSEAGGAASLVASV